MHNNLNDTIAAIATPPGYGGIGVVRVSGPDAFDIVLPSCADRVGRRHYRHHIRLLMDISSRLIHRRYWMRRWSPLCARRIPIRARMWSRYRDKWPFTRQRIVRLLLTRGARMANPGEFTLRAFLNGRLDLAQAEAVMDLISLQTEVGPLLAMEQLARAHFRAGAARPP